MKALLLRVGIDKSSDGVLAPIFPDGSFEYIPLSEKNSESRENRTYHDLISSKGKLISDYLPEKVACRRIHLDPEFSTFTYGDEGKKARYLINLKPGDLLVFYAGLTPYAENGLTLNKEIEGHNALPEALYMIGYFMVKEVINMATDAVETDRIRDEFFNNSHPKRMDISDAVLVVGDPEMSRLLKKAILISDKKLNKIGRSYHAVSPQMEKLLGISGSIQRSIPPRLIHGENKLKNLRDLLGL